MKRLLPPGVFRRLSHIHEASMRLAPFWIKYGVGVRLRRRKAPYRFLRSGDAVIQIGAPRDILAAGRSRAMYFSLLAGHGPVLVVEPDPANCQALRSMLEKQNITNVTLAPCGAWDSKTQLSFLANSTHPAANVLEQVGPTETSRAPGFERIVVEVDTIDDLASVHGVSTPRLVSITTNGAELQIVAGMKRMLATGYPEYICLAQTGPGYIEAMRDLGYERVAMDDRGHCFRRDVASVSAVPSNGG